eukprot:Gb_35422 [translate_table: standard]
MSPSLSAVWTSISAQNRSLVGKDLEEVHKAAKLFYEALPSNSQKDAHNLFQYLDKDRNGRVTKEELWQLLRNSRASSQLDYLFELLDRDNNGQLSFEECITLHYLIQARPECEKCGLPLVGLFYTCISCWDARGETNGAFNLCYDCYTSKDYVHAHQEFVDNYVALKKLLGLTAMKSDKIQCSVCGDIHDINVPPFFPGGYHIMKREDGSGYVCEWCIKRTCACCGNIFSSQHTDAKPRQWLMNNFYCKPCGKKFKRRSTDGSIPQCENCCFKIRNGELFLPPRVEKQSSTLTDTTALATASNNKNINSTNTLSPAKVIGDIGDIIDFAKMAFGFIQATQSIHSGEANSQCKIM